MTEDKGCKSCDALGMDSEIGVYYCCLSHRRDDLPKEFICDDYIPNKQLKRLEHERNELQDRLLTLADTYQEIRDTCKRLEQENKSLYEEKDCLHKIIDRLLENAGYSKDIASAEDFEDVYEDMQIKRNELVELEQENKELKTWLESKEKQLKHLIEYNQNKKDQRIKNNEIQL